MSTMLYSKRSALNLTLKGTIGSFKVSDAGGDHASINVKYLLTHVTLDFKNGGQDALLSHLAPVREIFNLKELNFDEIMQRDIDDARVSMELIPYLLDDQNRGLVKLFPPIVAVLLPYQEGKKTPAKLYPPINIEHSAHPVNPDITMETTTAGKLGSEVFQFTQAFHGAQALSSDGAELQVNTQRSSLVIVDGQHRAMALLALYRNLMDEWKDADRAPYRDYYAVWTRSYIEKFNLDSLQLPIIVCAFPELDESFQGDFDVVRASRRIFLTLNKNARKVSESRNKLLDDQDIVSSFLRVALGSVKQLDTMSNTSLRITSIELDQEGDKTKIKNPVALSGVSHLYYIIEHLMMANQFVSGIAGRGGKFASRKDLAPCMKRLHASDVLTQDVQSSISRYNYSDEPAEALEAQFKTYFGDDIVYLYSVFKPFEDHNGAALWLKVKTDRATDSKISKVLFDGQATGRVFQTFRDKLNEKVKEGGNTWKAPEISEIKNDLDATADKVSTYLKEFKTERARRYANNVSSGRSKLINKKDDGEVAHQIIQDFVDDLYDNVFSSIAFQAALTCSLFEALEKLSAATGQDVSASQRKALAEDYVRQLNTFFSPDSFKGFCRLVSLFSGRLEEENGNLQLTKTNYTFRQVVFHNEMQPDEWPRYRYVLLELWEPENEQLASIISAEREICRQAVFNTLFARNLRDYLTEQGKPEDKLEHEEREAQLRKTYDSLKAFVDNLHGKEFPSLEALKSLLESQPATPEGD